MRRVYFLIREDIIVKLFADVVIKTVFMFLLSNLETLSVGPAGVEPSTSRTLNGAQPTEPPVGGCEATVANQRLLTNDRQLVYLFAGIVLIWFL